MQLKAHGRSVICLYIDRHSLEECKHARPRVAKADLAEINRLKLNVKGDLVVRIPDGAKVIQHNADSTPTLGMGGYKWKISGAAKPPMIVFSLPKK